MSQERWKRMWDLFHRAGELPGEQRAVFLAEACAGDDELRREVDELLAQAEGAESRLQAGAHRSCGTDLQPATVIDGYRIVRRIGQGGMGVVFEAEQLEPVQRRVALKLIRAGLSSPEVLSRFETERQSLAALDHPSIAQVFDAGVAKDSRPYVAMELVRGDAIHDYCDERRLGTEARLDLFAQLCEAIQHAHQRGIIHRDLKPPNILVTEESGKPLTKIIDFGIARAVQGAEDDKTLFTQLGQVVGTPEYMSPEQAGLTGEAVDTRTDVYALGVVLYELLVGALPFDSGSFRAAGYDEMRRIIREENPVRPSRRLSTLGQHLSDVAARRGTDPTALQRRIEGDLDWIVMRCLEKDRDRRYQAPSDIAADIVRSRAHLPIQARPPSAIYRLKKFVRRHRLGVAAGGLITAALIAGISVGAVGLVRAVRAEREASRSADVANQVADFLTAIFDGPRPSERDADSVTARELLDRGTGRVRDGEIEDPSVRSRLLLVIGNTYLKIGAYEEARELLEEALQLSEQTIGMPGRLTYVSSALNNLGALAFEEGRYQDAVEIYERAREAKAIVAANQSVAEGTALNLLENLSSALGKLGRREEALDYATQALSIREKLEGTETTTVANARTRIGQIQTALEMHDEARENLLKSLAIYESHHGPDHPYRLYIINSLGILEWRLKNYEAARPYLESALESVTRTHGPDHPYTASLQNNLGLLLLELKEFGDAERLTRDALALRERVLGPDHLDVATSLLNLAQLLRRTNREAQAVGLYERAMSIKEGSLGRDSPELIRTLRSWAELLEELGQTDHSAALTARADRIEAARDDKPKG